MCVHRGHHKGHMRYIASHPNEWQAQADAHHAMQEQNWLRVRQRPQLHPMCAADRAIHMPKLGVAVKVNQAAHRVMQPVQALLQLVP